MKRMKNYIKKEYVWFYFAIIVCSSLLFLSFYNIFSITYTFPLKLTDISEHMVRFHLLLNYGFHSHIPNWYGGYTLFLSYPPLFSYYVWPFYLLTNDIPLAFYLSLISAYFFLFISVFLLCKTQKFTLTKSLTFFFIVFGSRFALSIFFEFMRLGELIGWIFFILLFTNVLYYKERVLDKKFILTFISLLAFIILSHFYLIIFSIFIILPFISIKANKQRIIIILSSIASLVLTSFWWLPFLNEYFFGQTFKQSLFGYTHGVVTSAWIIFIPSFLWVAVYSYFEEKKAEKKDLILLLPILFLSILFFSRLIAYVPIFNEIFVNSYLLIFLLIGLLFFFKKERYRRWFDKLILFAVVVLLPIASVITYLYPLENFSLEKYNEKPMIEEMVSVMPNINSSFIILPEYEEETTGYLFSAKPFYCYGVIYYNLTTPSGWYPPAAKAERIKKILLLEDAVRKGNCSEINSLSKNISADILISYEPYCNSLEECSVLKEITKMKYICIFEIEP